MAKPWSAVEQSPAYQALTPQQQQEAKAQYFAEVVQTKPEYLALTPDQQAEAHQQFFGTAPATPAAPRRIPPTQRMPAPSAPAPESRISADAGQVPRGAVGGVVDTMSAGKHLVQAMPPSMQPALTPMGLGLAPLAAHLWDKLESRSQSLRDVVQGLDKWVHKPPTTTEGRYIRSVSENAPMLAGGPETLGIRAMRAAGSGVGQQAVKDVHGGPVAQFFGSLAGGTIANPKPAYIALKDLGKRVLASTIRDKKDMPRIAGSLADFARAGTTPSAGQAIGKSGAQTIEAGLSSYPGAAGIMAEKAEKQQLEIGQRAAQIADKLSPGSSPDVAGRTIEEGISGPEGFVKRFRRAERALYDHVDSYVPRDMPVKVTETEKALRSLTQPVAGAEATTAQLVNPYIGRIKDAFDKDLGRAKAATTLPAAQQDGTELKNFRMPLSALGKITEAAKNQKDALPYEAVKALRTKIGAMLEDPGLLADVPKGQLKRLYAALTDDMGRSIEQTGGKDATQAWHRANWFSQAGSKRVDTVLDKVVKTGIPETIYKAATDVTNMQAGATKIASVMRSLSPAERDVVKSTFIRRMGLAKPGQQNAEGDVFSSATFLTNWNKMSDKAKAIMFSGQDGKLASDLSAIARVAENIQKGNKVFANPSGTAGRTTLHAIAGGAAGAAITGNFKTAISLLASTKLANITAKMMTDPDFVRWLATQTKAPNAQLGATAFNSLRRAMSDKPDDVKQDTDKYIQAAQQP
jgi:hypothetical protein